MEDVGIINRLLAQWSTLDAADLKRLQYKNYGIWITLTLTLTMSFIDIYHEFGLNDRANALKMGVNAIIKA